MTVAIVSEQNNRISGYTKGKFLVTEELFASHRGLPSMGFQTISNTVSLANGVFSNSGSLLH